MKLLYICDYLSLQFCGGITYIRPYHLHIFIMCNTLFSFQTLIDGWIQEILWKLYYGLLVCSFPIHSYEFPDLPVNICCMYFTKMFLLKSFTFATQTKMDEERSSLFCQVYSHWSSGTWFLVPSSWAVPTEKFCSSGSFPCVAFTLHSRNCNIH